jgi:MFS family permease
MSVGGPQSNGSNGDGAAASGAAIPAPDRTDGQRLDHHGRPVPDHYKWIALSNTTLGVLIATINASILLISLPDIFKGIDINPLLPSNTNYLLWLILGFLVVTAVLVVSLGRLGDIYGRAKTYNLGFAVFTMFSILLSVTWMKGSGGALWLIIMRALQGVGGAMLFANSSAIITDAFPANQRGMALGINGWPRSRAPRSAWSSVACSPTFPSASRRRSTGGATPPSRSGWSRS